MNHLPDFTRLAKRLGLTFREPKLFRQALTHRSFLNEYRGADWEHNERLEFLGDAVLELVMTDYLFRRYPEKTEGDLTGYRAALVNTQTIAEAALELGVNEYLLLSRGEAKDTGRARAVILANTFESIIGAVYLDQGLETARQFIEKHLASRVAALVAERRWQDAKSFFQERAQAIAEVTPTYEVLDELGPDHDKMFTVGLYLGLELVATGTGHSKQEAEQTAARAALAARGWLD
ncbi:MAG: ribonuclease III [Candidatus Vogelbacteria bacterium]|nr:ribonuclease III [Candidatus Vogelbacteria bacterium]